MRSGTGPKAKKLERPRGPLSRIHLTCLAQFPTAASDPSGHHLPLIGIATTRPLTTTYGTPAGRTDWYGKEVRHDGE